MNADLANAVDCKITLITTCVNYVPGSVSCAIENSVLPGPDHLVHVQPGWLWRLSVLVDVALVDVHLPCSVPICMISGCRRPHGAAPTNVVGGLVKAWMFELGPLVACGNPGLHPGSPGGHADSSTVGQV